MIFFKTEAGQRVLKDRSVALTPRQRTAFILCDGRRGIDEVLSAGMGVTREDIEHLVGNGLLEEAAGAAPAAATWADAAALLRGAAAAPGAAVAAAAAVAAVAAAAAAAAHPAAPAPAAAGLSPAAPSAGGGGRSGEQRYKDAYPIATRLTGGLGLRGFRLNLSVEGTSTCEQLLELLPKIQAAVGAERAWPLEQALLGP